MTGTARELLGRLMRDFGADWQIRHDGDTGIWTAVAYPTPTAQHVLVARDLPELAGKLETAQVADHQRTEQGLTAAPDSASPSAEPS